MADLESLSQLLEISLDPRHNKQGQWIYSRPFERVVGSHSRKPDIQLPFLLRGEHGLTLSQRRLPSPKNRVSKASRSPSSASSHLRTQNQPFGCRLHFTSKTSSSAIGWWVTPRNSYVSERLTSDRTRMASIYCPQRRLLPSSKSLLALWSRYRQTFSPNWARP